MDALVCVHLRNVSRYGCNVWRYMAQQFSPAIRPRNLIQEFRLADLTDRFDQ